MIDVMNVKAVAKAIGIPVNTWAGKCHEIASAVHSAGLVAGKVCYGHYLGPVSSHSVFHPSLPFQQHGWIETPGGGIYDPTRWVFEGVLPYIYESESSDEYDVGGNLFRQALQEVLSQNAPSGDGFVGDAIAMPQMRLTLGEQANKVITRLVKHNGPLTKNELARVANLPPSVIGKFAPEIYTAIIAAGHGALIPFDNRKYVLCEKSPGE